MTIDDLKFVRLDKPDQFSLIPRYLFEQVKGADFIIDRVYQYGPGSLSSPLTFMYVLAEKDTAKIKGVLWAEVNPYNENLQVNTLSIDKDYQGSGAIETVKARLLKIKEDQGLRKVQILTDRPTVYEKKYGGQRSEHIILEI